MIVRKSGSGALRPFDENQRTRRHDLVPANVGELFRGFETVQIDMEHGGFGRTIFVNQSVSRTRDLIADAVTKANRLHERGFAHTQLAGQRYKERRVDRPTKLVAPMPKLSFTDLEVAPVSARRNDVPVSWHL